MYALRQLTAEDRAEFRALRETALTANPDDFMLTAEEEQAIPRLSIEAALEKPGPGNLFIGAFTEDATKLIGIAGLVTSSLRKTSHCGHVTSLFVHPDHRRCGVARRLMDHLLTQAAQDGLRSVRLEVVAANRNAIALYEALGFTSYGCEPAAYCLDGREWDLLLMTRDCA